MKKSVDAYRLLRRCASLALVLSASLLATTEADEAKPAPATLAAQATCLACHGLANKIVGPGFNEVAAKYKGDAGALGKLEAKVRAGGSGTWGPTPMPPQTAVSDEDLKSILQWVLAGAPKS